MLKPFEEDKKDQSRAEFSQAAIKIKVSDDFNVDEIIFDQIIC